MFWRKKKSKTRMLHRRFIETQNGEGVTILTFETSKPILPAKPGFSYTIHTKKEPE